MTNKQHSHVVSLMSEYYETIDGIASLRDRAAELKEDILSECDPGRYGKYSVSRVKKTEIHVRAYVRRAYSMITRSSK